MNQNEMIRELQKIGIGQGTQLEVHSSLSSFGYVEGGAEALIGALKETVTETGSIFMPALRLSPDLPLSEDDRNNGIIRKIKILQDSEIRSRCGIVADTFRLLPDTRAQEGTFAIAAWGKNADKVDTGLGYLIDHQGKALLLGVDIYSLTAMHYVENNMPEEMGRVFKSPGMDSLYSPDEWLIEDGEPPVKAWYRIQDMAYDAGLITEGRIGRCKYLYFTISDAINLYKEALQNDPFELYGLTKDRLSGSRLKDRQ